MIKSLKITDLYKGYPSKKFGWIEVLKGINVEVPLDKNLGILGRNGAGKSTLMRLISGIDSPDSGSINTDGINISWPMGPSFGIHPNLTARENVEFVCRIYGRDINQTINYVEDFAELGKYLEMPLATFSSGMKSRLAFGVSMAFEFETYLVDEGFNAGDARFTKKAEGVFETRRGTSNMLLVSHNVRLIRNMAHFVGVLINGKLELFDNIEEGIKIYENL
jgi:capsular polysaccharide transport system ATP-binding protein